MTACLRFDDSGDSLILKAAGKDSPGVAGKLPAGESAILGWVKGQGGVAGFAKGEATVELSPQDSGTKLEYTAKAAIGGKLAQIGARLIDGVAKKIAGQFFEAFNKRVTPNS